MPTTPVARHLTHTKRNGRAARPNLRIMRRWHPSANLLFAGARRQRVQEEGLVHPALSGKQVRSPNKQIGGILVSPRLSWNMRFCGTVVADARTGEPSTRRARCIHSSRLFSLPVGSVLHRYRAGDAVGCGRMANL